MLRYPPKQQGRKKNLPAGEIGAPMARVRYMFGKLS
jgi:hypothetical protein